MVIEFTPGTVYYVSHLRPFDLELALQGHPLAMVNGHAVRAFRTQGDNCFAFDWWNGTAKWLQTENVKHTLCFNLRLAPLAEKDGRPLHVGDQIEVFHKDWFRWAKVAMNFDNPELLTANGDWQWRWTESKASAG